jgi:hypothetical protein
MEIGPFWYPLRGPSITDFVHKNSGFCGAGFHPCDLSRNEA